MANIVIFDPLSTPIPNMVLQYFRSRQVIEFSSNPNALINEDASGDNPQVTALIAASVPMARWKVVAGVVQQLSAADDTTIATANAAAAAASLTASRAEVKVEAKAIFITPSSARDHALNIGFLTLREIMISEFNILRAQHALSPRTIGQFNNTFTTTYEGKIDALPS